MSLTNDGLDEIYKKLQTVLQDTQTQKTGRKILQDFGVIAKSKIRENFLLSQDPYSVTWAPLKAGGRYNKTSKKIDKTAKPLLDTGRLVGSISYKTFESIKKADGYTTMLLLYNKGSASLNYADYHQFGTARITARPFYPTPDRGLPDSWATDINKITDKLLNKLFNS